MKHSFLPISSSGPLEIVFSFDTTGSMGACLEEIRNRLQDLIQRLQSDIPGIRIAVCAHSDYDDVTDWVTKWIDFSTNVVELCEFVQTVPISGSIDAAECYELVLREARTKLSWTPGSRRCLVLFGDELPHEADYRLNKDNIDWRHEARELAIHGVAIYGVQCRDNLYVRDFYNSIASVTGGQYLRLEDFGNLFDLIMAVSYKESGDVALLAAYEKEIRARHGNAAISKEVEVIFATLQNRITDTDPDSPLPSRWSSDSFSWKCKPKGTKSAKKPSEGVRSHCLETTRLLSRCHEKELPLLKRENVYEKNFLLSRLNWSSWILVLSPEKPAGQETVWRQRKGQGQAGFRLNTIKLKGRKVKMARGQSKVLFEVAVKTPNVGGQRHVVYSSFSTRCLNNASWERCLHPVRGQLDRVVRDGCNVYLRYSVIGTRSDLSTLRKSLERYDYAWKKLKRIRNGVRNVTKGKFPISVTP